MSDQGSLRCAANHIRAIMKVMNAVTSDVAGVVVEILVQNGHPVQYEQPLMVIDMAAA